MSGADRSLIVCPERHAAAAGERILRAGGNAADAAIATAFVQCVVAPFMTSIGGTSTALIWDARRRELYTLNCAAEIGSISPPERWVGEFRGRLETVGRVMLATDENQLGYRAIMIPGFVRGAQELFERMGSRALSWGDLLRPAIELARDGFVVSAYSARSWEAASSPRTGLDQDLRPSVLDTTPTARNVFLKPDGSPYRDGETFAQPDLARALEAIAENGPADFYTGTVGEMILADFRRNGALISADDLRGYQARIRQPVSVSYRGRQVYTNPPPAPGVPIMMMLNTVEGWDLGANNHGEAGYIGRLSAVMRAAFREYAAHGDDPEFVPVPVERFLSPERAAERRATIEAGQEWWPDEHSSGIDDGTTHVTAWDREGNIVLWTHSIGSVAGSGAATPGLGFLYNNFLGFYDPRPGAPRGLMPGKRTAGGGSCIVFEDGEPILALGSPGGSRLVSSVFQVIANVLDHGMDVAAAVSVPRFHSEHDRRVFLEPAFDQRVQGELEALGHEVERSTYMARVQAITRQGLDGILAPGTDPRAEGGVAVWPPEEAARPDSPAL